MSALSQGRHQVAESTFSFLHMELVQMALGPNSATPTTSQLQLASRKIEAIGFQVGQRLVERYTKDRPRFTDTLEIIKFICKDFWVEVYRKQIDKLQTNNRVCAPLRPPQPFWDLHYQEEPHSRAASAVRATGMRRACICYRITATPRSRAAPHRPPPPPRPLSRWRLCTSSSRVVSFAGRSRAWA